MKLRQWFLNRPIHAKLSLINILVVFAALVPIACITMGYEYFSVRRSMLLEAEVQADIIRDNVSAATAFGDADSANEILLALRSSPNVIQAVLRLPDGRMLTSYVANDRSPPPMERSTEGDHSRADWETIRVGRIVYLKENAVGWLGVETSMQPLHDKMGFYVIVALISVALGFAIALPLSRRLKESITSPLSDLMALAHHVTTHQDYAPNRRVNHCDDEIGSLSKAFHNMLSHIRERDLKLSQMAYYDNVTGLCNRHYFMERLEQAVANSRRYGTRCCLMFIDLDNFKTVNDSYGHHVGDDLLREVARHLTAVLRDNDVICRIGGDEFAVIIDNNRDMGGLGVLARKIIANLSTPMVLHGEPVAIGASIGLSACPDHADTVEKLLRTADAAMYSAKEQGKNCFRVYSLEQA
ncbi:MAG TPA: diguanylate cyclase [Rhodocyclaceae bacterium]|nr:diguanylate cyclase [Rhodocyclaceae bacterium]